MKIRLIILLFILTMILFSGCKEGEISYVEPEHMFKQLILDSYGEANTVIKIAEVSHDKNQYLEELQYDPYTIYGYGIINLSDSPVALFAYDPTDVFYYNENMDMWVSVKMPGTIAFEDAGYFKLFPYKESGNNIEKQTFLYNPDLIPKDVKIVRLVVRAYKIIGGFPSNQCVTAWIEHDLTKD